MLSIKKRSRWFALGVALAVLSGGSASAAPMYTLTDLGLATAASDLSPLQNSSAITFDAAGNVTHGGSGYLRGAIQAGNYVAHSVGMAPTTGDSFARYGTVGGPMIEIHAPNSSWNTTAFGLNAQGTLVGTTTDGQQSMLAYIYTPKDGFKLLPSFGGGQGAPLGINDLGQIVGFSTTPLGYSHAFVSNGVQLTDLNTLIAPGSGFLLDNATAINSLGQIVGQAEDAQLKTHEYILTPTANPVPEPTTLALFLIVTFGAAARGLVRRGRKCVGGCDQPSMNGCTQPRSTWT